MIDFAYYTKYLQYFCKDNEYSVINASRASKKYLKLHLNEIIELNKLFEDLNVFNNLGEILYRIKFNLENNPGCKICGNKVHFNGYKNGYSKTCCRSCMATYEHLENVKNNKYENDRKHKLEIKRPELLYNWNEINEQNDNWILEHFLRKNIKNICIDSNKSTNGLWTKNPINNDIVNYIKTRFNNSNNIEENVYWLYHKLTKRPVCPVCGGYLKFVSFLVGYQRVCSHSCAVRHPDSKQKYEQTNLERYGVKQYMSSKEFKEKSKETFKKRIKENYYNKPNSNVTLYCSKGEQKIFTILKEIYPDTLQYYKDKRYANKHGYCWECDFYIPSIDLFIEYQGFRTHGKHPFNKNDINDISELNKLKQSLLNVKTEGSKGIIQANINIWTTNDPYKRKVAKEHNLKYLELFEKNVNKITKEYVIQKIKEVL